MIIRGDIVINAIPVGSPIDHPIAPQTIGVVSAVVDAHRVLVDFGDAGFRVVNRAALDVIELPDGLDLDYIGDSVIEFALRCADAYLEQRGHAAELRAVCDGYAAAALNRPPHMEARLVNASGRRRENGSRS